ncbi:MAG TPA: N-methyl-L-tryptophan oxidase [Pirellulales bacterium]|nr:N-methyl-L-tryptophan oxidase [Pirellulales bacterium]
MTSTPSLDPRPSSLAPRFDAIVIGAGGVGSAAMFHLATRGARVLGLDRFPPGHDRGSSHGRTRIIRQAYYEHPDYVPLLFRAYQLWEELGKRRGRPLYHETGLLQVGPLDGAVLAGVRRSARQHKLEVEELAMREITERFPGFRANDDWAGLFERRAGYLDVEACVVAHILEAINLGAELRAGVEVHGWTAGRDAIEVATSGGNFSTARLIVSAGPWAPQLLRELSIPLVARRKPQYWYPADAVYQADHGCPTFLFDLPEGIFYGVPQIDDFGLKVAEHTGGQIVADPLHVDRDLDRADQERVEQFLAAHLPGVLQPCLHHSVCMYTLTPDEHFIVDRHPGDPRINFAAGLSGHGFKFSCVLGQALADLAIDGRTDLPIDFLSLDRPGLRSN